jgi:LytR cell envelope-related transcriptional attenuator
MDLIEQVGAILGLVAFVGLAVLVLLYFQQARDVRRLREWAGRAPERAAEAADEATAAAAREAGIEPEEPGASEAPLRERVLARLRPPEGATRRLPPLPYLAAAAAAVALIAVALVTGGFGLVGGDDGAGGGRKAVRPGDIEVAVLNGTGVGGAPGVPGLAEAVAKKLKKDGYKQGPIGDAGSSFVDSVIMYTPKDEQPSADRVASDLRKTLGKTDLLKMSSDVKPLAKDAPVAVVIGSEDSEL